MYIGRTNLKLATHANFVFDDATAIETATDGVLEWLRAHSDNQVSEADIEAHREQIQCRISGRSLLRIAGDEAIPVNRMRSIPVMLRHVRFCKFQLGSIAVSVDVFNAGNELGLPESFPRNVVEVFFAGGHDVDLFVDVVADLFEAMPVQHVFGGVSSFADRYVAAISRDLISGTTRPWEFLWPLTGVAMEMTLPSGSFPAYREIPKRRGVVIQLFADLWTGSEDDYASAARALGRRSLWEI